jgi:hypothetical protein
VLLAGGGVASGAGGEDDAVAGVDDVTGSSFVGESNNRIGDAERYELSCLGEGRSIVKFCESSVEGSNRSWISADCRGDEVRTELHGFSNDAGVTKRPPLTLVHGLLDGPIVDAWGICREEG